MGLAGALTISMMANVSVAAPAAAMSPSLADCNQSDFQTVLQSLPGTQKAHAYWLNRELIKWPAVAASGRFRLYFSDALGTEMYTAQPKGHAAGNVVDLSISTSSLPPQLATRFQFVPDGVILKIKPEDARKIPQALRLFAILVHENEYGDQLETTRIQIAGAIDDLYGKAEQTSDLGASIVRAANTSATQFKLWAPTAQKLALCVYKTGTSAAQSIAPMQRDDATGIWSLLMPTDLSDHYYQYIVDVVVPNVGLVRNRVTDPYSLSLTTDSKRSYITQANATKTVPLGWNDHAAPKTVAASPDMSIYEMHVRDFSINDPTVKPEHRGKYLAFTDSTSNGMQHLSALAKAGMTDIHLLPVFDFASVPEVGCVNPIITATGAASLAPQTIASANAAQDCFNWGYDPFHYSAPEGSYASNSEDGATRMREFRQMVMALHQTGLRVGMDVVYNHTFASGQVAKSILDRVVPGYYHRLNADGDVEQSSCCDNTATENTMMGKLLIDSVVSWAKNYRIDSFRFDLMAHQPRSVMERLQKELKAATGRDIELIGEGWNFGEIADGKRFVQASQLALNGTGIGTFNDRTRDAVRGGSSSDSGTDLMTRKGFINGLADAGTSTPQLLKTADMVRVGLAGSVRQYRFETFDGVVKSLQQIDYNGQPAGYVANPSEVVNYVENHDNQTLFDINVYKLPADIAPIDRVRVQMLGAAITAFSQGVAYFHAGLDVLRSKSMDSNSFNSGDWFNRIDWSYRDNYFATGLPPAKDNEKNYALMQPLLENPSIKPSAAEIALARDMFRDLLKVRASSSLFHLRTAAEIEQRLRFDNVGPSQNGAVIAAHLDGKNYPGAKYSALMIFINVAHTAQTIRVTSEVGQAYQLHPVFSNAAAGDKRLAAQASYDAAQGSFTVPALSAVVFVQP